MRRSILLALILASACSDGTTDLGDTGAKDAADPRDADPRDAELADARADAADPRDADPIDADPIDADPIDAGESIDAEPLDSGETNDAGRGCAAIEDDYQALTSRVGCQDMMQCQVVNGHCAVGLGGCWYTVNVTVTQADLDALALEYTNLGCTGAVCRCTAPPPAATCDQGICVPL